MNSMIEATRIMEGADLEYRVQNKIRVDAIRKAKSGYTSAQQTSEQLALLDDRIWQNKVNKIHRLIAELHQDKPDLGKLFLIRLQKDLGKVLENLTDEDEPLIPDTEAYLADIFPSNAYQEWLLNKPFEPMVLYDEDHVIQEAKHWEIDYKPSWADEAISDWAGTPLYVPIWSIAERDTLLEQRLDNLQKGRTIQWRAAQRLIQRELCDTAGYMRDTGWCAIHDQLKELVA